MKGIIELLTRLEYDLEKEYFNEQNPEINDIMDELLNEVDDRIEELEEA